MGAPHLSTTSGKPVVCKLHSKPKNRACQASRAIAYSCAAFLLVVLGGTIVVACYYGLQYHSLLRTIECENKAKALLSASASNATVAVTTDTATTTTVAIETTETSLPETTTAFIPSRQKSSDIIYTWKLRIVRQQEWSGNHVYQPDPLRIPVSYVIILQTDTETCSTETDCLYSVRHIHTKHKGFGLYCIGYNFLIGGDGNVYEGRGWYRRGVYTADYTTKAISIGFIGNFLAEPPMPQQMEIAQQLIANGVKFGMISPDYKLIADQQLVVPESDGNTFYDILKTWPHWTEEVDD